MKRTEIVLHTKSEIGPVDPRVFGGFLEHMGRAVHEGVHDPSSSHIPCSSRRRIYRLLRKREVALRTAQSSEQTGTRLLM